jgi:hypothetical protein
MLKRIGIALSSLLMCGLIVLPAMPASAALFDNSKNSACSGLAASDNPVECDKTAGKSLDTLIKLGLNIFSLAIGIAAVIMIMVGGMKYIISSGDANNVSSAKNTILYALVGLVVAALAQFVVKFVLVKVP